VTDASVRTPSRSTRAPERLARRLLPSALLRNGWTAWHVLAAAVLVAAGFAVSWEAWDDIYRIAARDEESSHIFLVPVVAGWLFWTRRGRLRACSLQSTWVGPAAVALGWALHSVGDFFMIQAFWHVGAVLIVLGCLLAVAGRDVLRAFLPAILVLCFLVPVPGMVRQQISGPLQSATAMATQTVLETLGVPVSRSGNLLSVNGVPVAIAEACNGLRMVFALVLVSYAFAYGTPLREGVRVLVLALSPVFAIVFNVFRLVPTVWLYGYYPSQVADLAHDVSGWLMLPIAFFSLLGILELLKWAQIPVTRFVLAYGS
jgi:exosortase